MSKEKLNDVWCVTSSVLSEAVKKVFPNAQPIIGEVCDNGFYYDFANIKICNEDLENIERSMKNIMRSGNTQISYSPLSETEDSWSNEFTRNVVHHARDRVKVYNNNNFKSLSYCSSAVYPKNISAIKLTSISSSKLNDNEEVSLTRIHGISFETEEAMKEYNTFMEEVKKRDHREIGKRNSIFMFSELAAGFPLMMPNGMKIMNSLSKFWKEIHDKFEYQEISTPTMCSLDLWKTSGHADHYIDNMFQIANNNGEEGKMALKAMNCPGTMLYFKNTQTSYKDLPLRICEKGGVFRNEFSGALSGLCRVKNFHQDDAHIFISPELIESEINSVIDLIDYVYDTFGLRYTLEIATRPEQSCGTDAEWKMATESLINVVESRNKDFKINEGDGAFYGPKIDVYIKDAINRTWQCGTVQLDFGIGDRFKLSYNNKDNTISKPVVIHRAIFGSFERFLAILLEHFSGRLPLWINYNQVAIIPVAIAYRDVAETIQKDLKKINCSSSIIENDNSLSKKLKNCIAEEFNYVIVVGEKEKGLDRISARKRGVDKSENVDYRDFIDMIESKIANRDID